MKKSLLKEHFNHIIREADEEQFQVKLQQIFKQNYPGFVSALGKFAADPKFRQFVQDTDAEKTKVSLAAINVTKLIPTQNEIDVDKSLAFPLTKAQAAAYALKGGTVKVASPIIVFNGKFIVDGHHRWSQLYAINKDAKIVAYNMTNPEIETPMDALKATQLAIIGAGATNIPKAEVKGKNLLRMDEDALKQYVVKEATDDVAAVFNKMKQLDSKEAIADYIWANVSEMQQTSQPVSGAPGRGIMPQADAVPGGIPKTIATLQQGIPLPVAEQLRKYIRSVVISELKKESVNKHKVREELLGELATIAKRFAKNNKLLKEVDGAILPSQNDVENIQIMAADIKKIRSILATLYKDAMDAQKENETPSMFMDAYVKILMSMLPITGALMDAQLLAGALKQGKLGLGGGSEFKLGSSVTAPKKTAPPTPPLPPKVPLPPLKKLPNQPPPLPGKKVPPIVRL
jgi:hypothetical protein